MLTINFFPECDIPRFVEGAEVYKQIWDTDGEKITETIERISRFQFRADVYNAIILDNKPSASYPLILLSSYTLEQKKATLIHELTHKVLRRTDAMKESELENHKVMDLILYEIWTDVYGEDFAKSAVEGEQIWSDIYTKAWDYALAFTKEQRKEEYKKYFDLWSV
jgi:Glu-tRNA(Gln) amidotransferase subunit E-like FAD-binding protein